ncbi:MAG TPA: hypothetical protein VFN60_13330 [Acidimicrobiales bacterium]|nr:hypothetical protein [Acidimicrobiales bacterium]
MRSGRAWLIIGAAAGVAMALGHFPYLAGAARTLAATALSLVGSGGHAIIRAAARHGASRRVVLGATAVIAVLVTGVTAWLCVLAAKGTLRLRSLLALILLVLGAASFAYHPGGVAGGTLLLAVAAGGLALVLTGPLVAAPLAALAGLLAGAYLPALLLRGQIGQPVVEALHQAIYGQPGTSVALHALLLVIAVAPFLLALRVLVRR